MNAWGAVATDSAIWAGWGVVVGLVCSRLSALRFATDGALTRLRPWERSGRVWVVTGVRRWKRFVPELDWLSGGVRKKQLLTGAEGRERLETETRRAEVVHWAACLPIFVMPLWGPAWVFGVMVVYDFCANVPCIIIQRYNRGRLLRLASRAAARPASATPPARQGGNLARMVEL
jgi:glycosyl-4,4'-diaponeurosporenoate acyltransferase